MRIHILLAGAAVSLAACSQPAPTANSTTTTATAANMTTPAAPVAVKAPPRVPGEWEYVSKVEMLGVTGAAIPGLAERMKAGPQIDTRRQCMSKEEAEEDISKTLQTDQGGCRFERIQAGAGKIAGSAICSNGGMEATGKMTGTVTPTATDMVIDMTMKLPGQGTSPPSSMKMRMTMTGKRVGDCTQ